MPVHGRALSTPRPAPDYFAPTTGEKLHGNGGQHVFPLLRDGADADRTIEAQCNGILLPNIVLPFDDSEFAGRTVADILRDPESFAGATLADPIEGSTTASASPK